MGGSKSKMEDSTVDAIAAFLLIAISVGAALFWVSSQ